MIARMSKYDFILYAGRSDDFLERLRELGLVDVTCTGWEPSEGDRLLIASIEGRTKALDALQRFRDSERFDAAAAPFATGEEAYERYTQAAQERTALRTEIGQTEKAAEEARRGAISRPRRCNGSPDAESCCVSSSHSGVSSRSRARRGTRRHPWR